MEECAQFTLAQRLVQIQSEFDGSIHRDESGATEAQTSEEGKTRTSAGKDSKGTPSTISYSNSNTCINVNVAQSHLITARQFSRVSNYLPFSADAAHGAGAAQRRHHVRRHGTAYQVSK